MAIMNFREYGASRGISYQAVRKLYINHEEELKEYTSEQNGTKYLTDEAQKILDGIRKVHSPMVIFEDKSKEEIEELNKQLEELRKERDKIKDELIETLKAKEELIAVKAKYELYLEDKQAKAKELEELKNKVKEAETEASKYKRSIFGLYRKEKA